jgi:hypothetical protein
MVRRLFAGAKRIRTLSPTRVRRPPADTRFVADTALEEARFEPSVPHDTKISRGLCRLCVIPANGHTAARTRPARATRTPGAFRGTDGFESGFLQRRVSNEPGPAAFGVTPGHSPPVRCR